MLTNQREIIQDLNIMLSMVEVPFGEENEIFFSEHFILSWKQKAGGFLTFDYRNQTGNDLSDFSLLVIPVESQFSSGNTYNWHNLALPLTVPTGRYRFRFPEPQL